jgi:GT2 family glycosyltransferase
MTARVAAVILNYCTADDTILAVRSLQAADSDFAAIVVVDNGSSDGSVDAFRRQLAGVDVIPLPSNQGFSGGCNAGIEHALRTGATDVLLLNSDVIVPPDMLPVLLRVLERDDRIGIVSPIVRRRRHPDRVESLGLAYHQPSGRMRMIGHGADVDRIDIFDSRLVDAVSGCAMLVRRDVFEAVGLLRSEYFFGFEDLDFCCRAREHGFLIACAGKTFVLHEGGRSIGPRSASRAYFATRNHLLLAKRFPGGGSALARGVRLARVLALNLAHAIRARDIPTLRGLVASLRGARDFALGRFGSSESMPEP